LWIACFRDTISHESPYYGPNRLAFMFCDQQTLKCSDNERFEISSVSLARGNAFNYNYYTIHELFTRPCIVLINVINTYVFIVLAQFQWKWRFNNCLLSLIGVHTSIYIFTRTVSTANFIIICDLKHIFCNHVNKFLCDLRLNKFNDVQNLHRPYTEIGIKLYVTSNAVLQYGFYFRS